MSYILDDSGRDIDQMYVLLASFQADLERPDRHITRAIHEDMKVSTQARSGM